MTSPLILTTRCVDRPGVVASLSTAIRDMGGNIIDAQQFDDPVSCQFFARIVFSTPSDAGDAESDAKQALLPIFDEFDMRWTLRQVSQRKRVLILASRFDHCLGDLMYRWRIGELEMDVVGIVSNYPRETYRNLSTLEVPFYHLPITPETKREQEAQIVRIVEEHRVDLVVLARYMQILSDDLSRTLSGRCINIHHSFLPGFKGAKPYHQAFERGVKLIGATAHYVTGNLDEGPIIEQDIERVSHRETPEDLVRKGRDIERRVQFACISPIALF